MTDGPSDSVSRPKLSPTRTAPPPGCRRLPARRARPIFSSAPSRRRRPSDASATAVSPASPTCGTTAFDAGDPAEPAPGIVRRVRRPAPGARRQHRPRPLPAAGLPRRRAAPAVLAGAGHRAGPAGGADLRRPGRRPARRRGPRDPGPHHAAEPDRQARHRPGPRRRPHRRRRPGRQRSGSGAVRCRRSPTPSPSAVGAVRAMQTLAAAAEAAHHAGVALSIDHPSRVRVSIEGDVVLAFPATMPDATPEDDIRGIGAALYALLVNRWPLPESGVRSGMAPATARSGRPSRRTQFDRPRHPVPDFRGRRPADPGGWRDTQCRNAFESLTAGDRGGRPHRGARPDQRTRRRRTCAPGPARAPADVTRRRHARVGAAPDDRGRRRGRRHRGRTAGPGVGAEQDFGDVGGASTKTELGLNGPSARRAPCGSSAPRAASSSPSRPRSSPPAVKPTTPARPGSAIDGNPGTAWETDIYHDAVPFPGFKNGVGLMLQLPQPTVVGAVNVDLASTGTKIQIRSSSTPTPAKLEDTTVLTPADGDATRATTPSRSSSAPDVVCAGVDFDAGNHRRREPRRASPRSPCKPRPDTPAAAIG